MSLPPLPDTAVRIGAHAEDWRAAVGLAGDALMHCGSTTEEYTADMVRMIEQHGPYVVVAPGLALAHARPGPAVLAAGLCVITLRHPVAFGHPHNDPVSVVLGLALPEASDHLSAIAAVANIFNDSGAIARLTAATSAAEVQAVMGAAP